MNGTRQYIGARYVPLFYENSDNTSEWRNGVEYEPLTIVTWNGNSYTSKKKVPASVGNPSENPTYWVATGIYSTAINQLQSDVAQLKNTEMIYTPEMSGAVGDGVTDDTSALLDAIAKCINNGYTLMFKGEKTYCVSNTLQINDYFNIEGNGATIKAIDDMSYVLNYLIYPKYDSEEHKVWNRTDIQLNAFVRNLNIDCNGKSVNGIRTSGYMVEYDQINVVNVNGTGIHFGGISRVRNTSITCNPVETSIGLNVASNDNFIENIAIVDAKESIVINGYNRISHVTAWTKTPEQYSGTVFIHDTSNVQSDFYEIIEGYCDTIQIMFKADHRLHDPKFIACRYQHNDEVSGSNTEDSYILYGVSADSSWFPNVTFTNCVFIGKLNNYTQICNADNSRANFETNNVFIHLAKVKNNIYNSLTPPTGVTANNLRVVKQGTLTHISIDVTINVPQTDASTNYNIVTLGQLSGYVKPLVNVNFTYGIRVTGDNEYYVTRFFGGVINGNNGKIMIMIPQDLMNQTGIRATAEVTFINPQIHTAALGGFLTDNT